MEDYTPINPDEPCLVSGVYYYVINETVQLVTTQYLTTQYSTTTNMKQWVIQEFYRKTDVDEIIRGLEERISALEASNV